MSTRCAAIFLLSILCTALLLLEHADAGKPRDESKGKWRRPPPPQAAAGSKLFHNGEDALSWDNDELVRIHNLHLRDFNDIEEYLNSPNLATYLGLHQIDALHMSVPLNLVLIGFSGDGNSHVEVTDEELISWFSHVDHVLPHTRISLAELSCSEDGHCSGTKGSAEVKVPPSPLPSYVHLNISCNVVVVKPGAVMAIMERAIHVFSRPVDPDHEMGDQQVDALKMEGFINSFISFLGLDRGYTMLVLNPRWSPSLPSYTYRIGFSESELTLLNQMASMPELNAGFAGAVWGPEPQAPVYSGAEGHHHAHWANIIKKYKTTDLKEQSFAWVNDARNYLAAVEDHNRKVVRMIGPKTKGTAALARAAQLMQQHGDLRQLLQATIKLPPEHMHNPRFHGSHPLQDCGTPLWVSQSRWLMLDLTAKRSDWGPALGGDGVVVHNSLPDVGYTFGIAEEKRADKRQVKAEQPEDVALRDSLNTQRTQRLAVVAQQQQHASQLQAQAHVVHGAAPGQLDPNGNPVQDQLSEEQQDHLDKQHEIATLQAELNVYEEFALTHCSGRVNPPSVCAEAEETVQDLRHTLELLSKSSEHKIIYHPEHHWNIFGKETDDEQSAAADSAAKDVFFADLSNILSKGLRHAIAPPSATWHHQGYLHDTASPFAHQVHFTIYTIQDTSRTLGTWRARGINFDLEAFKHQLSRLAMPHQSFTFNQISLNLLDDPTLAAAFSVSLKTSFLQVPHSVQDPVDNEVVYLDSQELAFRLRQRFNTDGTTKRASSSNAHALLEVPVFIFELDRDMPVLIDEHYNAKALEDLVLVVQNSAKKSNTMEGTRTEVLRYLGWCPKDEHPTGMMCEGMLLQRPMSPLKHALSAVLQHLGGVLPPHLGYNPGRKLVQHDWLWSVGAHPLSWTSWGAEFSQLHIDALHRSYILDAIDSSVDLVNDGIALLQEEEPHPQLFKRMTKIRSDMQQLLQQFSQAVNVWRAMVANGAVLDYHAAAEIISTSEQMAKAVYKQCQKVIGDLHPHKCAVRGGGLAKVLVVAIYGSSVAAGLAVAVVLIYPLLKKKAKAI